jgi:type II secretory pathway pseudopilin PulG
MGMRLAAPGTAPDVEQMRRAGEAGFTLVEIVIVVAIVVTTVLAGVAISLGSRSFAVATAASQFDHMIDSARTIARETQGATLLFAPDVFGDGTEVRVMTPAPDGSLSPTVMPVFHTRAAIEESESLGKAPFAFVVHASGALGGRPGYRTGNPTSIPEVGCPASGSFHFLIHTAGATAERTLPCKITLAATGPLTLTPWPPASVAPMPTPCSTGPCAPSALPTPPSSSPTCPPNFTGTPAGCSPTSATMSAPHYHVTAALGTGTMTVGGTNSLTATATLSNPENVTPGTPGSIPVLVVASGESCAVAPPGAQPSNSVFSISGLNPGSCSLTVSGDVSSVAGATTDTATVTLVITGPSAPSTAHPCDLVSDGKCYQQIVARTSATFWKYVAPDIACGITDGISSCWYVDSVQGIDLGPGYGLTPPTPAIDADHDLLFRIDAVGSIVLQCQPFSFFGQLPAPAFIDWGGYGVGSPTNPPDGFGQPSTFFTQNHIVVGQSGSFAAQSWSAGTTTSELYDAIARGLIGAPSTFNYWSTDAATGSASQTLQWIPDFPGCDALFEPESIRGQYGTVSVILTFEVFQAAP